MPWSAAVFGIYKSRGGVENAFDSLKFAGFRMAGVSVLFAKNVVAKDFAHEKDANAPEGASVGAGSCVLLGGSPAGWQAGIGTLVIPGLGPFYAAGPLVGLLSAVGVDGTIGGLAGALVGAGIPEFETKRYDGRIHAGGILLSVHCDDSEWTRRAKMMLQLTGAEDIFSSGESSADSQACQASC